MSGPSVSKLVEAIADCRSAGREIRIVGSHSKREWLPQLRDDQDLLHMREFGSGIIDYQPEELVLTAYAGTSIKDLQAEVIACKHPSTAVLFLTMSVSNCQLSCALASSDSSFIESSKSA